MSSILSRLRPPFHLGRAKKVAPLPVGRYRSQLNEALDLLGSGLKPFVEQTMRDRFGDRWHQHRYIKDIAPWPPYGLEGPVLDVHLLLKLIDRDRYWDTVFHPRMPGIARWQIDSLRELRNRNAHYDGQDPLFDSREQAEQLIFNIKQVLQAIANESETIKVERILKEIRQTQSQKIKKVLLGKHPASISVWIGIFLLMLGGIQAFNYFRSPRLETTRIVVGIPNREIESLRDLERTLEGRLKPANFWAYLSGQKVDIELQSAKSYPIAAAKLRSREWDIVFGYSPVVSLQALDADYRHVGVMFPHNPGYSAIIFSRKDSPIQSLEDIRPQTVVAFGDPFSASKFYLPWSMLRGRSMTLLAGLGNREILDLVKNGGADVGTAAMDPSYFKPEEQGFQVIAQSDRLPTSIVAISPNLSDRDRAVLSQALITLPESVRAPEKANFAAGSQPDYRPLRRIIEQVRASSACLNIREGEPITFTCPQDKLITTQGWVDLAQSRGKSILLSVGAIDGRVLGIAIDRSLLEDLVDFREAQDLVNRRIRLAVLEGNAYRQGVYTIQNPNQIEFLD